MNNTEPKGRLEGVEVFLWCLLISMYLGGQRGLNDNSCVQGSLFSFFSAGGMWLPALGCLMETQAGSAVSLAGPSVCVTTWCRSRGDFTPKSGPNKLATSTTGVSRTTGANILNHLLKLEFRKYSLYHFFSFKVALTSSTFCSSLSEYYVTFTLL